jgi:hypothetical protein
MDSKRAIMAATEFHPFGDLAVEWAAELGVEPAWLRRQLIMALQDGLLEPYPEDPPPFALRDNLTLKLKTIAWSDFSDVAEARAPDIARQLKVEGRPFDLVDIGEIVHEATLMISDDLIQRMAQNPDLAPPHVWYEWSMPPALTLRERPSPPAGPEKPDPVPDDAEVHTFLDAHPEWKQKAARSECRKRWPGLRERPQWRRICEQRMWKLGRPPGK